MMDREKHFEERINATLDELKNLLVVKGKEYRRNNNPFHNFERGAQITGNSREEVLQGFLLKHLISVDDMRQDFKKGVLPLKAQIEEKYNDILVYFLLEKAMMLERSENYNNIEKFKKETPPHVCAKGLGSSQDCSVCKRLACG